MINYIPFGKENKISKKELMEKTNINTEERFKKELSSLRKKYIIMTDSLTGGYWRSNNPKELREFIKKYQTRTFDNSKMIMLAYKELEELNSKDYKVED